VTQQFELSGDVAKLRIVTTSGQLPFRFATLGVSEIAAGAEGNLNNSELQGFSKTKAVKHTLHLNWSNASYDPQEPYGSGGGYYNFTGGSFVSGQYISLIVYANGLSDLQNTWIVPNFYVSQSSWNVNASDLQPWSCTGWSSGGYQAPGLTNAQMIANFLNFAQPSGAGT
jgi:hypothetical protein